MQYIVPIGSVYQAGTLSAGIASLDERKKESNEQRLAQLAEKLALGLKNLIYFSIRC